MSPRDKIKKWKMKLCQILLQNFFLFFFNFIGFLCKRFFHINFFGDIFLLWYIFLEISIKFRMWLIVIIFQIFLNSVNYDFFSVGKIVCYIIPFYWKINLYCTLGQFVHDNRRTYSRKVYTMYENNYLFLKLLKLKKPLLRNPNLLIK
jgi:hypothetical protein